MQCFKLQKNMQDDIEPLHNVSDCRQKKEVVTNLKSIMALAISFPKKRNFILILAMCAGLVVLPKGTANSPLELNMYFVPSWLPVGTNTSVVRVKHTMHTHTHTHIYMNKLKAVIFRVHVAYSWAH